MSVEEQAWGVICAVMLCIHTFLGFLIVNLFIRMVKSTGDEMRHEEKIPEQKSRGTYKRDTHSDTKDLKKSTRMRIDKNNCAWARSCFKGGNAERMMDMFYAVHTTVSSFFSTSLCGWAFNEVKRCRHSHSRSLKGFAEALQPQPSGRFYRCNHSTLRCSESCGKDAVGTIF